MPTQHVPEAVVADDSPDIMGALLPEAGSAHGRHELRRARDEVSLAESSCHLELLACKDFQCDKNTNLDEVIAEHAAAYTFFETQSMLLTQAEMLAVKNICIATSDNKNACDGYRQLGLAQEGDWHWDAQRNQGRVHPNDEGETSLQQTHHDRRMRYMSNYIVEVATPDMDSLPAATSLASTYIHVTAWGMTTTDPTTCIAENSALSPPHFPSA